MIRVRGWPAAPTNGSPCLSSSAPGASPTNISGESTSPTPKSHAAARPGDRPNLVILGASSPSMPPKSPPAASALSPISWRPPQGRWQKDDSVWSPCNGSARTRQGAAAIPRPSRVQFNVFDGAVTLDGDVTRCWRCTSSKATRNRSCAACGKPRYSLAVVGRNAIPRSDSFSTRISAQPLQMLTS